MEDIFAIFVLGIIAVLIILCVIKQWLIKPATPTTGSVHIESEIDDEEEKPYFDDYEEETVDYYEEEIIYDLHVLYTETLKSTSKCFKKYLINRNYYLEKSHDK